MYKQSRKLYPFIKNETQRPYPIETGIRLLLAVSRSSFSSYWFTPIYVGHNILLFACWEKQRSQLVQYFSRRQYRNTIIESLYEKLCKYVMELNQNRIATISAATLFSYRFQKTMKICPGIASELHRYDATLMKLHDTLNVVNTAREQRVKIQKYKQSKYNFT